MNITAIKSLAIVTAFHQLDYCPDTSFDECWDPEFVADIKQQAYNNLDWLELDTRPVVTDYNIANAIWGLDEDAFVQASAQVA